jgi:hypothetical protein
LNDNLGWWFNLWGDLGRGGKVEEVFGRKLGFPRRRVTQRYLQPHYSASLHGPMSCLSACTILFFSHHPYEGQLKHLFTSENKEWKAKNVEQYGEILLPHPDSYARGNSAYRIN